MNVGFTFLTLSFKFYKLINLRVFWASKLRNLNRGSLLNNSIDIIQIIGQNHINLVFFIVQLLFFFLFSIILIRKKNSSFS